MIDITSRTPDCKIRAYDTGEIVISASLAKRMDITEGDRVQILMQDSDGFPELFISKTNDKFSGLETKCRSKGDRSLRIFSKRAAEIILKGKRKGLFRVGEMIQKDGIELHTIIYCRNYAERKEVYTI